MSGSGYPNPATATPKGSTGRDGGLSGVHRDDDDGLMPDIASQLWLDLAGVFVFALSGGLVAVRGRLDLFGVLVLSWVAGLGGGMLRDVLLGVHPPVGVSDWRLLAAAGGAGALVFVAKPRLSVLADSRPGLRLDLVTRAIRVLDAAGLGLFAVSGTLKALGFGTSGLAAVLIGGITAVGGGLLRDLLAGQVPEVLRRELYAVPALLGATVLVGLHHAQLLSVGTSWAVVAGVVAVRLVAVALDLHIPVAPAPPKPEP